MMFGYNHTKRSGDAYKSTATVFRNRKKEVDLNNLRNYILQDEDLIELGKRSSFFEFRFLLSSRKLVNKIEIKIKRKIAIKNVIKTDLGIER